MGKRTKTAVSDGPVPIFPPYEYRIEPGLSYFGIWDYGGSFLFVDDDRAIPIEEAPKIIKSLLRSLRARKERE